MTDDDIELRLRAWYRAAVTEQEVAPVQLRNDLEAIARAPANGRHALAATWRSMQMNRFGAFALAGTAAVLLIVLAVGMILRPTNVGPSQLPAATNGTTPPAAPNITAAAPTIVLAHLDGQLAFDHNYRDNLSLWGNTDTGIGPLFSGLGAEQSWASWSPDGATLMFAYLLGAGDRIFTSQAGAAPTAVATGCKPPVCLGDGAQAISPDGRLLAFRRILGPDEPTSSGIVISDVSGANGEMLTEVSWSTLEDKAPSWSPDGSMVVFAREEHDSQGVTGSSLFILTVATGEIRRLTPEGVPAADPDWSANGLIVFATPIDLVSVTTRDLSVIAPDGTGLRSLTAGTAVQGVAATPCWAEGGSRIVFSRLGSSSTAEIWVMNADGSQPLQVTAAGGLNAFPAMYAQ